MADPLEIERKYIIEIPEESVMQCAEEYSKSHILQIYLKGEEGLTHRIRKRIFEDVTEYTETTKIRLDAMTAIENERVITEEEFLNLEKNIKEGTRPIYKIRHTFVFEEQVFEVDVYPEWKNSCILETELNNKETRVVFPTFINIIKEVTGIKGYSNAQMSMDFPKEII